MQISISNAIRGKRNSNTYNKLISLFIERGIPLNCVFEAKECLQAALIELNLTYLPVLTSNPVISGENYAGSTVSTTNGVFDGITNLVYTYQWLLDGSPILGATNNTYTVTSNGDLTCKVTATNDFGSANSTSNSLAPSERLIFSVKTDNAGTSASNQFTIPTSGTGYLYDIETSDGQVITGLTSDTTITFPTDGTYDVFISGSFPQFYFNNVGDKLKLLDIKNFGIYALGSTSQQNAFFGCSNLIISAIDFGHFENVTSFINTWRNCTSLTSFPLIDTSSGTTFSTTWQSCPSLTSFPLLDFNNATLLNSAWLGCLSLTSFPLINTSSGVNFSAAWQNCSSLTSFPLIDTSSGTNFTSAWQSCSSLTSFPLLDTSSATSFSKTWRFCINLVDFPSNYFDTNTATNYTDAFNATNLTTQSIDNILVSLDTNGVINGTFTQSGGGNTPSATGLTAKANLISKGWTVTTN